MMPELTRALPDAIPSHLNIFMYADRNGEYADIYSEYPKFLELNVQFLSEFVGGADGLPSFADCMRTRPNVEANEGVFPEGFFRSDYYNVIFRPQGVHLPLQSVVKDRSGRSLGALLLYRAPGDRRYSPDDMRLLASLLPHIAHGMRPRPDVPAAAAGAEDRGILIVQPPSHLQHVIPAALSINARPDAGSD